MRGRWVPPKADIALAGALALAGLVEAALVDTARPPVVHALMTTGAMATLAWRRRFPLGVLVAALAGIVAVEGPAAPFVIFTAMVIASYSAGAWLRGARSAAGLVLAVVPLTLGVLADDGGDPADVVAVVVLYGGAWALGRLVAERTRRADELADRTAVLEAQDAVRRAEAAAEERARIARELHDIVSHSISVIAVQTQAVRRRLGPEHAREQRDLQAVETTARQAMAEMRRLFGVLRGTDERPPLAPQPGLDQLPRLLERTRAAGVPVALEIHGERVPLPPGMDLAAYRVIQEGLTNTLKHAGGASATVTLTYNGSGLQVMVDDAGRGVTAEDRAGHGIIGMRERVALYGGRFDAGPRADGGFRVSATFPLEAG